MLNVTIKFKEKYYKENFSEDDDMTLEIFLEIISYSHPGFEVVCVLDTDLNHDIWPELKDTITLPSVEEKPNILIPSNSEFKFRLGGSKLIYDTLTERLDILHKDGSTYGGLHCGDRIDVYINGKWEKSRIEKGEDWLIVGLFAEGQIPEGLLVKYGGERILYS